MPDASAAAPPARPIEVFCAYSHTDEALLRELEKHLSIAKRSGLISVWYDRKISGGREWEGDIDDHLNSANIILLLVSPDFIHSDYCYDKEMKRAMERHNAGEARVIPVILREVDWEGALFGKCQGLPKDMKPVTSWTSQDAALKDVAVGIRRAANSLLERETQRVANLLLQRRTSPQTLTGGNTGSGSAPGQVPQQAWPQIPATSVSNASVHPRATPRTESPSVARPLEQPSLEERVNTFVEWLFKGYEATPPKRPKVINDALLGNLFFTRQEVAVIDCPVLQRLRRIKQTGLVHYVYPSAIHTRFEHSLGAAALSERCFNAVQKRATVEGIELTADERDLAHLRMAALLHDVGHGLCSHASEQIYALLSDLQEFKYNPFYATNAPGEILSCLIVKSPAFQKWFGEHVNEGCGAHLHLSLETISKLILGKHDDKGKYFLANIISSAYDCDKLDYIARDSYYCGLALTVDLPRFYSMISTAEHRGHRVLVLRNYVPLEQILFSKMTLFGSVYHHQKVKCLDSMLRSMIGHIVENPGQASFPIRGGKSVSFTDPVQYLYATDDDFFGQVDGFGDDYIRSMLTRFRHRDLFVRCVDISRRTVKNWDDGRQSLIDLTKLPKQLADLEAEIHRLLPSTERGMCNKDDIRLSIPGLPPMTGNALIQTDKDGPMEYVEEYFPVKQWTDAYAHNKWRSYVYAPREIAPAVRDAAISVLRDYSKLEIDPAKSNQSCHL